MSYSTETTHAISNMIAGSKTQWLAAYMLAVMRIVEDDTTKTAATDGRRLYVGPWFRSIPIKQRVFVLCHEVLHSMLRHLERGKLYKQRGFGPDLLEFSPPRFNQAADYVINPMLTEAGIGEVPPIGILNDSRIATSNDIVDVVYERIPVPPPEDGSGSSHGGLDEHMEPAGDAPTESETKEAIQSAISAAKAMGNDPGEMGRIVGELLEPKQHWPDLLQDDLTQVVGMGEPSWRRLNRRRLAMPPGIPFPGQTSTKMGPLVVAIDTSGSISEDELTAFISEMGAIIEQVKPETLHVCWWDTSAKIFQVEDVSDVLTGDARAVGGGGTNWDCVPRAIEEEGLTPDAVITFTDGYVNTSCTGTEWPHICLTTGMDFPFGKSIKMDISADRRV